MYLTKEEEKILNGYYGYELQKVMSIIVKVGEIMKADRLVDIDTTHISGISYRNIGDAGLEFLEDLSKMNIKFQSFTTLNPAGACNDCPLSYLFSREFLDKQSRIISIFKKLNANLWLTCTPYEYLRIRPNTYHAWCESNAIAYLNSVFDARSEKLPGIFAIYCSIIKKVPRFGLYRDEKRRPNVIVKVKDCDKFKQIHYDILGKVIAEKIGYNIPYLVGLKVRSTTHLKHLLASYATYSPIPFMIIHQLTRNYEKYGKELKGVEKIEIDFEELDRDRKDMECGEKPELILIGCPHANLEELDPIINRKFNVKIIVSTSRFVFRGLSNVQNIDYLLDTCPVVSPILENLDVQIIITNSLKLAYYVSRLFKVRVYISSLEDIIQQYSISA